MGLISWVGLVCREVHLPSVYVHASICETDLVYWFSRYLCSIGGGGTSAFGICAFSYMSNLFGVVVFQRFMLDWRMGMESVCHGYMCILVYVKRILCSGVA